MQDIADRLHVSRSTVSLVISGKAGNRISEAMQKKVIQTAKEMNYHINSIAKSLRTGETKLIGVVVTDISNEFFGRLTFYIQEYAKTEGYLVLTINSNESAKEFEEMIEILMEKTVDGVIVVPPPGSEESIAKIISHEIPMVTIDRSCEGADVNYVGVDNFSTTHEALQKLIDDGYRNIAMVGLGLDIAPLNDRQAAYEETMKHAGLEKNIRVFHIGFGKDEDKDMAKAMAETRDADAIFFTSRRVFSLAMPHKAQSETHNGRRQCLLCFDDVGFYNASGYDIKYIEQPVKDMAHKAFELLLKQIKGDRSVDSYLFPVRYINFKTS